MNILGKRIKRERENKGLSQIELAKLLKISNTTLSQYETGQRIPGDEIKIKLADIFECTLDYLLGRTDNRAENILDLFVVRRTKMPPWLSGHEWSGDSPGARLRQARIAKNMTIQDLSKAVGITARGISRLETGKVTASLPNLRKLAQVLRVPIAYLGRFEKLPENTLGQRITKARLYHGLTKEEMAQIIGLDPKTLRSWEQDKHKPLNKYFSILNSFLAILNK